MRKLLTGSLLISILLFACKTDDDSADPIIISDANVLVVNEGNFGFGNGSVSLYNSNTLVVNNKLFQTNNSGRPIGDVVQSIEQIGDKLFIVVNNSSKIEVVDVSTFKSIGNISPLNSPRYILPIDSNRAYVSDLYEDKIYIINPNTMAITGTIDAPGWIEEMKLVNNMVFAANVDSSQVWVIDPSNNQIVKKVKTNKQPQHIEVDVNDKLWISCSGGFQEDLAALYKINSSNYLVEKVFEASDSSFSFGEIELNKSLDKIYYLSNDGVFAINITDTVLATTPYLSSTGKNFYGLKVNRETDELYVCDAIDYQQKGLIYRYDNQAKEIHTFRAGIIPSDIFFIK